MPKKQKTAIIAPLGLSPPVITAGTNPPGFRVSDLVIIATKDPAVLAGLDLIRVGMSIRAPKVQIREEILPFDDVTTTEENLTFMERVTKIIREERVDAGCDRILLNVAGGRKNMCITLALIGQLMNADGIFHIGNRSISLFNQNLERLRDDIGRIYAAKSFDGKQAIYREKEKEFNHLLFRQRMNRSREAPDLPGRPGLCQQPAHCTQGNSRGTVTERKSDPGAARDP